MGFDNYKEAIRSSPFQIRFIFLYSLASLATGLILGVIVTPPFVEFLLENLTNHNWLPGPGDAAPFAYQLRLVFYAYPLVGGLGSLITYAGFYLFVRSANDEARSSYSWLLYPILVFLFWFLFYVIGYPIFR